MTRKATTPPKEITITPPRKKTITLLQERGIRLSKENDDDDDDDLKDSTISKRFESKEKHSLADCIEAADTTLDNL